MSLIKERRHKVVVVEHSGHGYSPEALTVTVDGKPVEVLGGWRRLRDGGTSFVQTSAGELYRPSPHGNQGRIPTLNDKPIILKWTRD